MRSDDDFEGKGSGERSGEVFLAWIDNIEQHCAYCGATSSMAGPDCRPCSMTIVRVRNGELMDRYRKLLLALHHENIDHVRHISTCI